MSSKNSKYWKILTKISDKIINKFPEFNQVFLQLLFNRDLKNREIIDKFLYPDIEKEIHDPFLFKDMRRVVEKIIDHIKKQNKIIIYGDYDVDGVTSTAILYEVITKFNGQVDFYIPDRVSEGYGLNKEAIDEIAKKDVKLLITVDNGIRNKEEVNYIKEKGIDIVLTDHHVPPDDKKDLPDCLIINPMVGNSYPFKYLSGAGVAYKLACALIEKSKISQNDKNKLQEQMLDLVCIGTIADCVALIGENRVIVKKGLEIINKQKRIGLKKLIEVSSIKNKIEAWNIGFQIGPRLNAAGRMDTAMDAFHLLTTKDLSEAEKLAENLNKKNQERQYQTSEILKQAEGQLSLDDKILIAISDEKNNETWNEGIIGLVSGRLTEKYYKPTLIITKNKDEYKGSGRSIEELNIIEVIEECQDLLEKYGGHAAACGFVVKKGNLDKFISKVKDLVDKKLKDVELLPKIEIESELNLSELDEDLLKEIDKLAPFGQENEKPKFVSYNRVVLDIKNMGVGGQHIKLRIKNEDSKVFSAVGFSQAEKWEDLKISDTIDIVYYAEINDFNGKREVQLKIIDIKNSK